MQRVPAAVQNREGGCFIPLTGERAAAPQALHESKGPFSFAKENGPFGTPRERLSLQASSSKSCNACRLHCPRAALPRSELQNDLPLLLSSAAALLILWECSLIFVYRGTHQCGERSNAAFGTQSAAEKTSLAPHGSKVRLRMVTTRRDSWRSHVHRTYIAQRVQFFKPQTANVKFLSGD